MRHGCFWTMMLLQTGCLDYDLSTTDKGALPGGDTAQLEPDIVVSPSTLDFGALSSGASDSAVFEVFNQGTAPLTLTDIVLVEGASAYTLSALQTDTLEPGQSTAITVTVDAADEDGLSGRVEVHSNDPDTPVAEVMLVAEWLSACTCPEGFDVRPDEDGCERVLVEAATYNGDPWLACLAQPYVTYNMYGALYPDGTVVSDPYWGQNDSTPNGRLNEVGVWACDPSNPSTVTTDPVGAWIGFAVCVEIPESGDYLVGLSADNRMRFYVDGSLFFEKNSEDMAHFNYWWMSNIALSSGTHVIEIHGYNDGGIAALGAEFSGPFPAGSVSTDADMIKQDYAGHILWSTADTIGDAFTIGGSAGWSCPDGATFNACAEDPECVRIEQADCL